MESLTPGDKQRIDSEFEAAIESLNRSVSSAADKTVVAESDAVDVHPRIESLENQLAQHQLNFEQFEKRFDELGRQIAALCEASSTISDQHRPQPPTAEADAADSGLPSDSARDAIRCADSASVANSDESTVEEVPDIDAVVATDLDSNDDDDDDDDESERLEKARTHSAASLDSLLAKLTAFNSDDDSGDGGLPQTDENQDSESVQTVDPSVDEMVNKQKNEIEALFASLRINEKQPDEVEDVTQSETVEPADEIRQESDAGDNPQGDSLSSPEPAEDNRDDVDDILARLNRLPEMDDDRENHTTAQLDSQLESGDIPLDEPGAVEDQVVEPELTAPSEPARWTCEDVDSDDVQDYMNSLLQRLKGGVPAKPISAAATAIAVPKSAVLTSAIAKSPGPSGKNQLKPDVDEDSQPPEDRLKHDEFLPKRVAPEKNVNMAAMRELANASSRSAVKSNAMKLQKANSNFQLLLAGGGIAGAAATSTASQTPGDMFFCISIALLIMSIACCYCYAKANILGHSAGADSNDAGPYSANPSGIDLSKLAEYTASSFRKLQQSPEEGN